MQALSAVRSSVKRLNSAKNTNDSVIWTSLKPDETAWAKRRNTVRNDSQKDFQSTNRHHLPWLYCSNTNCTHGIVAEMWDIHIELYYIIM